MGDAAAMPSRHVMRSVNECASQGLAPERCRLIVRADVPRGQGRISVAHVVHAGHRAGAADRRRSARCQEVRDDLIEQLWLLEHGEMPRAWDQQELGIPGMRDCHEFRVWLRSMASSSAPSRI